MIISSIVLFFSRDCAGGTGPAVDAPKFGVEVAGAAVVAVVVAAVAGVAPEVAGAVVVAAGCVVAGAAEAAGAAAVVDAGVVEAGVVVAGFWVPPKSPGALAAGWLVAVVAPVAGAADEVVAVLEASNAGKRLEAAGAGVDAGALVVALPPMFPKRDLASVFAGAGVGAAAEADEAALAEGKLNPPVVG